MNRRRLLALLGLGSASGVGYLVYDSSNNSSPLSGDNAETDTESQLTSPSSVTGSEAAWQATMQTELSGRPFPTEVTFADEQENVTLEESETLNSISVNPTDAKADIFRFETSSTKTQGVADIVRDSLGILDDFRIEGSVSGETATFDGGQAATGPYVAAIAVLQDRSTIILVRADSRGTLETLL